MSGMILFVGLLFGAIAVWAVFNLLTGGRKPEAPARPMSRTVKPAPAADDPWRMGQMRRRERDSVRPGQRLL